jgi:carbon storage regulator
LLFLERRIGERIKIGDNIWVNLVSIQGEQAHIGIEAPRDVLILRGELRAAGNVARPPGKGGG